MIPGIKIGPQSFQAILDKYTPRVCEVWFRVDWENEYRQMFSRLKKEKVATGLHFWGILPKGVMPNFAFDSETVRKQSIELVKKTIEIAAKHGFSYVNIHPGSYLLLTLDLDKACMCLIEGQETAPEKGKKILLENLNELNLFAKSREVKLLVETLPSREPENYKDLVKGRLKTFDVKNVNLLQMVELAEQGVFICNDFCHTAAEIISDDRDYLFAKLLTNSKKLAKQTKLLHVNTMPPPFNGTDAHLGILNKDFNKGVFPDKEQLKQLLSLFVDRDDVWVIPEPYADHVENTLALIRLLEEIEKER